MLPNFVIIGAQKAGTTSLWQYLSQHPQVFVSAQKEPNFFVAEDGWSRGIRWYKSLFESAVAAGASAVGEASVNYTMFPLFRGVPERMARTIPAAKLIYLVRNPIDRMLSAYVHDLASGRETLPAEKALRARPHYADASRYALQIEQYLEWFERSAMLILLAEDLDRRREATLDRVLSFLDLEVGWRPTGLAARFHETTDKQVPRSWWRRYGDLVIGGRVPALPIPSRIAHSALTRRPVKSAEVTLSDEVRAAIEDLLRPDVERLREHIGAEFDGWGLLP